MKRRIAVLVLGAALTAGGLWATGEPEAPQDGPKKLVFYAGIGADSIPTMNEDIHRFEAGYPGLAVEGMYIAGDEKLLAMIAAGTPPDVFWTGSAGIYAAEGHSLAFDDYLSRHPELKEAWYTPYLDARRGIDGSLHGLPNGTWFPMIYYNTAMLRQAGLTPPPLEWTWDDLVKYAKALTRDTNGDGKTDQWGIQTMNWTLLPFIYSNGGTAMNESQTQYTYDSPEAMEALQFTFDLYLKHKVMPVGVHATQQQVLGMGAAQAFFTRQIAMLVEGPVEWMVTNLESYLPGEWNVATFPVGPSTKNPRYMASVGGGFSVAAKTKYPDIAMDLVVFLCTERNRIWYPNSTYKKSDYVKQILSQSPTVAGTDWERVYSYMAERTLGWPQKNPWTGSVENDVLNPLFENIWRGTSTVQDIPTATARANTALIDEMLRASREGNLVPSYASAIRELAERAKKGN